MNQRNQSQPYTVPNFFRKRSRYFIIILEHPPERRGILRGTQTLPGMSPRELFISNV